jgi:hypothetical protein
MSAFRIDYCCRGARKWLADPRRRFFTERATAEADLEGIDQDQWETRIVEILRDKRARLPSPAAARGALGAITVAGQTGLALDGLSRRRP